MSNKLLNKTTRSFQVFSIFVLLIAAPVFYNIINRLYIAETDETLLLHKEEFTEYHLEKFKLTDIPLWNKYNRNVQIISWQAIEKDILINKVYFDTLENEKEPYRELHAPILIEGKKFTYLEKTNLIENEDMVIGIAGLFLFVIVILLSGILLITKISSRRIWKPFYHILDEIQDFEIDKSKKPNLPPTKVEEFDRLSKSLVRLIEKNTDIYNNQREFVENAAHELQTPLALFQSKIDTLLQLQMTKDQALVLEGLNNDVSRLNRLNKNLLMLSKIENQVFDKQSIILNDYLEKHLAFFKEQAKAKNITVVANFSEELAIEANPALVEVLINNLFLNAVRHNIKNGTIIISIDKNSISFSNSGEENELAIEKMFNRFSKLNPASQGNGLGLAIVKKIVEQNNWNVSYSHHENLHTFFIRF